ncbi:hypothetical protein V6599_003984 [Pseudomonas aeruginosa]
MIEQLKVVLEEQRVRLRQLEKLSYTGRIADGLRAQVRELCSSLEEAIETARISGDAEVCRIRTLRPLRRITRRSRASPDQTHSARSRMQSIRTDTGRGKRNAKLGNQQG